MQTASINYYYGKGKGKSTLCIGQGVRAVSNNKVVFMIQFSKSLFSNEKFVFNCMEPDFKIFKFDKTNVDSSEKKAEIDVSYCFTKKILETGECDVLILDGIIDAIKLGYIDKSDFIKELKERTSGIDVFITGDELDNEILEISDFSAEINIK